MRLDRTDEEESLTLPSATTRRLLSYRGTPFAQSAKKTGLVGYDGMVLEVTEASQVVTVILF
jgi:hypothetical protein